MIFQQSMTRLDADTISASMQFCPRREVLTFGLYQLVGLQHKVMCQNLSGTTDANCMGDNMRRASASPMCGCMPDLPK